MSELRGLSVAPGQRAPCPVALLWEGKCGAQGRQADHRPRTKSIRAGQWGRLCGWGPALLEPGGCLVVTPCINLELILNLEKTLESPLDCKEIPPVHPKGNQS